MIPKNIYSLTFIQESKYNFKELSFKGYKNLGPRNNKIFFFYFNPAAALTPSNSLSFFHLT